MTSCSYDHIFQILKNWLLIRAVAEIAIHLQASFLVPDFARKFFFHLSEIKYHICLAFHWFGIIIK